MFRLWLWTTGVALFLLFGMAILLGFFGIAELIASVGSGEDQKNLLGRTEAYFGTGKVKVIAFSAAAVLCTSFGMHTLLALIGDAKSWLRSQDKASTSLTLRMTAFMIDASLRQTGRRAFMSGGNYFTDTGWILFAMFLVLLGILGYHDENVRHGSSWVASMGFAIACMIALRIRLRFSRDRWLGPSA